MITNSLAELEDYCRQLLTPFFVYELNHSIRDPTNEVSNNVNPYHGLCEMEPKCPCLTVSTPEST